jgi:hypothetical protein
MNQFTPEAIIKRAIEDISGIKGKVGVDPKWLNRTLSHLDNAFASSTLIIRAGSLADTPEASTTAPSGACICPPFSDIVDAACPVHGHK